MTELLFIIVATLFLAYANGANDTFKGVATLYGSGMTGYRPALIWATVTTLAGSLAAAFLAGKLQAVFSGRGFVPDAIAGTPEFMIAVALAAGCTVILATRVGIPVSTTHALIGGLIGAGAVGAGGALRLGQFAEQAIYPLAVAPAVSIAIVYAGCTVWKMLNRSLSVLAPAGRATVESNSRGPGEMTMSTWSSLRVLHFLSGGAVGFARGLNDTPKIVAIVFSAGAFGMEIGTLAVALTMAVGGLLHSRRVATTMSKRITPLPPLEGTMANLTTAFLVLVASKWGMPVSTTHVSVAAITGVGAANASADWRVLGAIASAWLLTLPFAALVAAMTFALIRF